MTHDIRWKQRYDNYQRALQTLDRAVDLAAERPLSELENQGLIHDGDARMIRARKLVPS